MATIHKDTYRTGEYIGLWLDTTSEALNGERNWIVSRDESKTDSTMTIETYGWDDYQAAQAKAIEVASAAGLIVVEIDEHGREELVYDPNKQIDAWVEPTE